MATASSARDLMISLRRDEWRVGNPFSDEMARATAILADQHATEDQKRRTLAAWFQKPPNQPCLFGRIAAATGRLHYCVLSDEDLYGSDDNIERKIQRERRLWKHRGLKNSQPEHGFVLAAVSQKIISASPDDNLLRLADRLRELWGVSVSKDEYGNDISWETLYLRNPKDKSYVKFTFSLDYFGAQGDGL